MKNSKGLQVALIVLALLVVAGGVVFVYRDKIFKSKSGDSSKKSETKEVTGEHTDFDIDYTKYVKLADYDGIELKKEDVDEDYQSSLDSELQSFITYKKKKDGKVKSGDTVYIYYQGKVDGEAFEGGTYDKSMGEEGYPLTIGSGQFIPGFEDKLIGEEIGDTVDIDVTFPDEYQNTELAGKDAVFTVELLAKRGDKVVPEVTDKFVKKNFKDTYKDADDMKETLRNKAKSALAWNTVCDQSEITEYPEGMVENMENQLKKTSESYLSSQGASLEDYLKDQNMSEKDFNKQITETAKQYVGRSIIAIAIVQDAGLEIDEKEYQKQIDDYIDNYKSADESIKDVKTLDKYFLKTYGAYATDIVMENVYTDTAKDYVAKNAKEK
jgi:trigger factor